MTIRNKLVILKEENVVDFKKEGKNKIFSLKRSIEARNYLIIAELYKQSKAIETYPILRGIIHEALKIPDVCLVLLFGSYAKGTAHEESDIDLFIETRDIHVKKDLEKRYSMLSVKTGIFDRESPLIREIQRDHIIVKGVEDYFERLHFFD
jgi:predicted nucleotidyltransferase